MMTKDKGGAAVTLTVKTTRFGELEIEEQDKLVFVEPILGFSGLTDFVLYRPEENCVFMWLQSMQKPELAFVVCDPRIVVPDYRVEAHLGELASLEIDDPAAAQVLTMVSHPHDVEKMTINLMGPLVVNKARGLAKQLVLNDPRYTTRHKVFPDDRQEG